MAILFIVNEGGEKLWRIVTLLSLTFMEIRNRYNIYLYYLRNCSCLYVFNNQYVCFWVMSFCCFFNCVIFVNLDLYSAEMCVDVR